MRGYKPYAFQSNKVPRHYQEAGHGPLKGQRKKHNKPDFSHNVLDDEEWWDLLQTSEGDEDHNPDLSPELASLLDSAGIEITAASHAYVIEIVTPQGLKVPYLFRAKDWWLIADEVRELYGPQVVVSVANAIKGL